MKPEDFILNTDYLSLAQTGAKTYNISLGGFIVPALDRIETTADLDAPNAPESLFTYQISRDGKAYRLGPILTIKENGATLYGQLYVNRASTSVLKVTLVIQNTSNTAQQCPIMNFQIKECIFIAPDLF